MNKMNNRIRELIKLHGSDSSGKWVAVDKVELIAESIVKECISVLDNTYADARLKTNWDESLITLLRGINKAHGEYLKEHFGVEE